jgi:hypothetical protein
MGQLKVQKAEVLGRRSDDMERDVCETQGTGVSQGERFGPARIQ